MQGRSNDKSESGSLYRYSATLRIRSGFIETVIRFGLLLTTSVIPDLKSLSVFLYQIRIHISISTLIFFSPLTTHHSPLTTHRFLLRCALRPQPLFTSSQSRNDRFLASEGSPGYMHQQV